jgi:uncharacterized protein (TIGR03435 family)
MSGGPGSKDPGRVSFENVGLGFVIGTAYDVKYYQVSGPDWLDTERFDIVVKLPEATTKENYRLMLQNLLAERFKLTLHRSTKEMPIYALIVAKNGPKLKQAAPNPPPDANDAADKASGGGGGKLAADGYPAPRPGMTIMSTPAGPRARLSNKEHMEWLAGMLSGQLGRPVIDATGLTGEYDISLYWIPQRPDSIAADDPSGPDLFAALQQQLGLKLEPKKGPIEVLIIDHAERTPTAN